MSSPVCEHQWYHKTGEYTQLVVQCTRPDGHEGKHESMKNDRPSWDEYFLAIAEVVATRADCTRSKVGAVLVNARHEIRGTGYNGSPAGLPGCLTDGACPRGRLSYDEVPADSDYANCIADHAERNALRHTDPSELAGATLYVTRPPCPGCTTLINACGITRVVTPEPNVPDECTHYFRSVFNGEGWFEGHRCIHCGFFEATPSPGSRTMPEPECAHLAYEEGRPFHSIPNKKLRQTRTCSDCRHTWFVNA